MGGTISFDPPGPGTWRQDRAHNPDPVSRLTQELYPEGFGAGFTESFDLYGVPVQAMHMAFVHGFPYMRLQFVGEPDADAQVPEPEAIGAQMGRCIERAGAAFENKVWRDIVRRWDDEHKPAAIAAHDRLAAFELAGADDAGLAAHIEECVDHHRRMAYLHHRFNTSALLPIGDFALAVARWAAVPPDAVLPLFEGASPISGVWSDEIAAAALAVARDPAAMELVAADKPASERLAALRELLPDVDAWVRRVDTRIADGFDVTAPTLRELPELLVGKLEAAARMGSPTSRERVERAEGELRDRVPPDVRASFDEMLADARLAYRLRDERGVFSDMQSAGLLRLALLELGRRLAGRGLVDDPALVLEAGASEVRDLAKGAAQPDGAELGARRERRGQLAATGAPPFLGPPPEPPPPPDSMPPPLARVMAALGYTIQGVLGEVETPSPEGDVIHGFAGSQGVCEGRARVIHDVGELVTLEPGDVLVTKTTSEAFNSAVHLVSAIVTDHGGVTSHAAIVSREIGIPAVVGTVVATQRIDDGSRIRVDGEAGTVTVLR